MYTVIQALERGNSSLEFMVKNIPSIAESDLVLYAKNIIKIGCHLELKKIAHLDLKSSNYLIFP